MQHKTGAKGFVSIHVKRDNEKLKITVEDNGIGRRAAAARKSSGLKEYPSKGMRLTEDRIDIMNKLYKGATIVEIFDSSDVAGTSTGTRIVITLPFFRDEDLFS